MGDGVEAHDIEVLLRLAQSGSFGARIVTALMRRIIEIQDHADETELLAIVAQIEALLRPGAGPQ